MARSDSLALAMLAVVLSSSCSRVDLHESVSADSAGTEKMAATEAKSDAQSPAAPNLVNLVSSEFAGDPRATLRARPGELLVRFKASASAGTVQAILSKQNVRSSRAFSTVPGLRLVKLAASENVDAAVASYAQSPEVLYAEPNYIQVLMAVPNDPRFPSQWGLHNTGQMGTSPDIDVDAPEAWDVTTGNDSVVVGVIDTGIDYNHEDLAPNIFANTSECNRNGIDDDGNGYVDDCHGIDAVNADSDPMDDEGHGTAVAGVIGAVGNNGVGVAGIAWHVKMLPCKFSDSSGGGTTADAITCLDYIAAMKDRGVNIVATNNSWGNSLPSRALLDAIAAQRQRGIVFVAPAGNDQENNDRFPQYPCTYAQPNVLCVASMRPLGILSDFSGRGRVTVHLAAPGEDIPTTGLNNSYVTFSGTSAAVPHVVGALALLKAQDPNRDWRALKNLVLSGSLQGSPTFSENNLLNIERSMSCSNATINSRLRPVFEAAVPMRISRAIGDPLELQVLHVNCASPAGNVTLTIQPGGETVTLRDDGTGGDIASGDGVYTAEWTPTSAGTFTIPFPNSDNVEVDVDPLLKPGFPVKTLHLDGTYHGGMSVNALVGNIDADPKLEILASGLSAGPVYAWHSDGGSVAGWPPLAGWNGYAGYPALCEIDRTLPGSEVFTGYFYTSNDGSTAIYSGSGAVLPGWPKPIPAERGASLCADLDLDGIDEVFTGSALRGNGTPFNPSLGPSAIGEASAIADLDGDEIPEVVTSQGPGGISQGITVEAFHTDNSVVFGFPRHYLPATTNHYPLVGDVDGDGAPEIVILTQEDVPWDTSVRILAADGTEQSRTVIPVGNGNWGVHASLADLDGDGFPEIVVHGSMLYVLKGDGSNLAGWPVDSHGYGPGSSAPVIGDVDGDGFPDVVAMTNPYDVGIWDRHGVPMAGFARHDEMLGSRGVPAIADIDLDGRNDIVLLGEFWNGLRGMFDSVWALDLHGAAAHGPIEWGQYKGDAKHSGAYETGKNLPNHAYLAVRISGSGTVAAPGIQCGTDCIERYAKGTTVTLTATPGPGRRLVSWRGACSGSATTCQVRVDRFRSVVAEFDDRIGLTVEFANTGGSGTVTSSPGTLSCPANCTATFVPGTSVTLTATPAPGSVFIGWYQTCPSSTNVCTMTLDSSRTIKAGFRPGFPLTVTRQGTGFGTVSSDPAGIDCGATCSAMFPATTIRLQAQPLAGSVFSGWGGACTGASRICDVAMTEARDVSARFELMSSVTVSKTGTGHGLVTSDVSGINCGTDCSEAFTAVTSVTLSAVADPDSTFLGWSGSCTGTATCIVSTDTNRTATARFELRRALNVTRSGTGSGSVTSSPAGINCGSDCAENFDANAVVRLTASAANGSAFDGWTGACNGTAPTCDVTMNNEQIVVASFRTTSTSSSSSGSGGSGGGGGRLDWLSLFALVALLARRASWQTRRRTIVG